MVLIRIGFNGVNWTKQPPFKPYYQKREIKIRLELFLSEINPIDSYELPVEAAATAGMNVKMGSIQWRNIPFTKLATP